MAAASEVGPRPIAPARAPRAAGQLRLMHLDRRSGAIELDVQLHDLVRRDDIVVLNDAATLPASLFGDGFEVRLLSRLPRTSEVAFRVILFGAGDWHTPTEHRPPPPALHGGQRLRFTHDLEALVLSSNERSAELQFIVAGSNSLADVWSALYRAGRPVQYAHVPAALDLWDVQNAWAQRPWAVEQPSAGRLLGVGDLIALRRRGVTLASLTEAAGLSSTGDSALDAALPAPERWQVPRATRDAIAQRPAGARVIAIGTSSVRALESAARSDSDEGTTDLRLNARAPLLATDGLLTGLHEAGSSHFELLSAFCPAPLLDRAWDAAARAGYLAHEFGDALLIL